jgi:hypothetical protein
MTRFFKVCGKRLRISGRLNFFLVGHVVVVARLRLRNSETS